jgi:hypothetical protein
MPVSETWALDADTGVRQRGQRAEPIDRTTADFPVALALRDTIFVKVPVRTR